MIDAELARRRQAALERCSEAAKEAAKVFYDKWRCPRGHEPPLPFWREDRGPLCCDCWGAEKLLTDLVARKLPDAPRAEP
jgi:hypothetical protein